MPEEAEVETESLHEAIHEELEKEGGTFLKRIALTTAVLAALAAIASLKAGATVNEALVLKTEATRLQAQASDQWAYYQAKGVKGAVEKAAQASWLAAGKALPEQSEARVKRYEEEQKEIEEKARETEKERDLKSHEADELLHRHHGFANAVALFQVSIALGAVAALTRIKPVWYASMLVGLIGIVFFGRVLQVAAGRWRGALRIVLRSVAALVVLLGRAFLYANWWRYPKRTTNGVFSPGAAAAAFKVQDIPKDHAPSESEVQGYVDKILGEMTPQEKVHQMSGDTWIWDLLSLLALENLKYNDRPTPSGLNKRLAIPAILSRRGRRERYASR